MIETFVEILKNAKKGFTKEQNIIIPKELFYSYFTGPENWQDIWASLETIMSGESDRMLEGVDYCEGLEI